MTAKTRSASMKRLAYSIDELGEMAGLSRSVIEAHLSDGTIASTLIGGRRLLHWRTVDALLSGALSDSADEEDDDGCLTYTIAQIAEVTPLSKGTIAARIADQTIPSFRIGGKRLVRRDVLDALLQGQPPTGGDPQ